MKTTSKLIIFIFAFLVLTASAYAQTPREELQRMVEQLQKSPNDNALREKIITLATSIKPAPAIPEEAREPFVMGATVLKKASDPAGASKAVDLFTQALNIAPWFADAYYNRAIAREAAGQFEPAIDDLKLYLGFKLTDGERREAQDKIYSLKADAQLASSKKAETEKIAAAETQARRFEGNWYRIVQGGGSEPIRQSFTIGRDTNGNWRLSGSMPAHTFEVRLEGTEFKFKDQAEFPSPDEGPVEYTGSISADGRRLKFTFRDLPYTPAQYQARLRMAGGGPLRPPNDRFGHEEWLKE